VLTNKVRRKACPTSATTAACEHVRRDRGAGRSPGPASCSGRLGQRAAPQRAPSANFAGFLALLQPGGHDPGNGSFRTGPSHPCSPGECVRQVVQGGPTTGDVRPNTEHLDFAVIRQLAWSTAPS